jgi:hypothetical protein
VPRLIASVCQEKPIMATTTLVVDPASSRIAIRTRATGMLAKLAHDLEIVASSIGGKATLDGEGFSAELVVPVAGLAVAGTLHGDRVDTAALSSSDRAEIQHKIRDEVFAATKEVRVKASGATRARADVTVEIATGRVSSPVTLDVEDRGDVTRVAGRVELSMKRLGLKEVKGPLNAFRVSDGVEVLFDLTLRPAS